MPCRQLPRAADAAQPLTLVATQSSLIVQVEPTRTHQALLVAPFPTQPIPEQQSPKLSHTTCAFSTVTSTAPPSRTSSRTEATGCAHAPAPSVLRCTWLPWRLGWRAVSTREGSAAWEHTMPHTHTHGKQTDSIARKERNTPEGSAACGKRAKRTVHQLSG